MPFIWSDGTVHSRSEREQWHVDGAQIAEHGSILGYYIARPDGGRVGQTFVNCGFDERAAEEHARLIAAAPDLLAALRWMVSEFDHGHGLAPIVTARIAIAKAEGR